MARKLVALAHVASRRASPARDAPPNHQTKPQKKLLRLLPRRIVAGVVLGSRGPGNTGNCRAKVSRKRAQRSARSSLVGKVAERGPTPVPASKRDYLATSVRRPWLRDSLSSSRADFQLLPVLLPGRS
eukprot:933579-Pyramimonas_sp.AAC.2